ncbi:uncharacterized protein LOC123538115 [Mercenaria mercenaria]|uniref:uncharacterized protein LOC123538115 n=1 Tax=Mercenaria mercenaria TaxID=6596 RepID=UPI00234EA9B9|nr:uncharacterized protein LOC123538115 [Mercenaria mercenaria]
MATFNPENVLTQTQDSDELQEMHCEQCEKHFNKNITAEGFCVDCMEYMCQTCLNYHRIYMSQHALKDKDSMPQDFCFEKCTIHQNLLIKFYCSACKIFACSECKINSHINCEDVNHLPTIVYGIEQSDELQELTKNLDSISRELEDTKVKIESNIKFVSVQEAKAKSTIKKRREEALSIFKEQQGSIIQRFNKEMSETIARLHKKRKDLMKQAAEKQRNFEMKIDKAENEVTREAGNAKNVDLKSLESIRKKNERLVRDLKIQMSDLTQNRNSGQRCKLFYTMKNIEQNMDNLKIGVNELKENNKLQYYSVEPEENTLTEEAIETAPNLFLCRKVSKSERKRMATLHCALQVEGLRGRSLCLLSDRQLLYTDYKEGALLVLNNVTHTKKTFSRAELPSSPWAIAKVENNKIAVTHPQEGIIRMVTFSKSGEVIKIDNIASGNHCYGIAYCSDKLVVSYTASHPRVQILDMSSKVLKTFDQDSSGQPLFKDPHYVAVSPENENIYVSDCVNNTVTSLDLDGKVKAIYKDNDLKEPYQLTVDECGSVYVCGQSSNNIHQLSSNLAKVNILLDKHHGIDLPVSVTYCQKNNRLYVGLWNGTVKVFNLTLK